MSEYGTRLFYGGGRARIETCAVGAKNLDPVDIPFLRRLKHQAIKLVLQASKGQEWRSPKVKVSWYATNCSPRMPGGRPKSPSWTQVFGQWLLLYSCKGQHIGWSIICVSGENSVVETRSLFLNMSITEINH